jgi:hypothetical protein
VPFAVRWARSFSSALPPWSGPSTWYPAHAFLRVSGTRNRAIPEIDQIPKPWMLRHLRNIGSAAQMRTIIFLAA